MSQLINCSAGAVKVRHDLLLVVLQVNQGKTSGTDKLQCSHVNHKVVQK